MNENISWLIQQLYRPFFDPIAILGGLIDTVRSWRYSRKWFRIALAAPGALSFVIVCGAYGTSILTRNSARVRLLYSESEQHCPTSSLERLSAAAMESQFAIAMKSDIGLSDSQDRVESVSDETLRYVELMSTRLLEMEPSDVASKYRLALVCSVRNRVDDAKRYMSEVADGRYGEFFKANAWMAKRQLLDSLLGEKINHKEFNSNLEKANQLKEVDYRLLIIYARVLEAKKEFARAVEVTRKAAVAKPEMNLELARLHARLGDEKGMRDAAFLVEDYFGSKLNTSNERESDRLAVSEALAITKRLNKAEELLAEGVTKHASSALIRRQLSEVRRHMYVQSVQQSSDGKYTSEIGLLESAIEADPTNAAVTDEVARLLPLKIRPSKKLLDHLKSQVSANTISSNALMMLAEGYYRLENFKEAQRYWELAIEKNPTSVEALNNFALCLAKTQPDDAARSIQLMERAINLSPQNAELFDSFGEILLIANRPKDAVTKLEMAIRLNGKKLDSRKRLVEAYRKIGMEDMAAAQTRVIAELEKTASGIRN